MTIRLTLGSLCLDLVPTRDLYRATAALGDTGVRTCFGYGELQGDHELREMIASLNEDYYGRLAGDLIVITHGASEAIGLVSRALLRPGDTVIVEAPTYRWALPEFLSQGASVIEVGLDEDGLCVDELETILHDAMMSGSKVSLLYVMPTFQNPTGRTLTLERRRRLVNIAAEYHIQIVEDDPYYRLRYEEADLPPLYLLDQSVIHIGTFSKTIAPGLRLGWLVGTPKIVDRVLQLRANGANPFLAAVVRTYLSSTRAAAALERLRMYYRTSVAMCEEHLAPLRAFGIGISRPFGGFYLWIELPSHCSAQAAARDCAERGVLVYPGDDFYAKLPRKPCLRLSFAAVTHDELRAGLEVVARCLIKAACTEAAVATRFLE